MKSMEEPKNQLHEAARNEGDEGSHRYTLTVEEASSLFLDAGIPRSPRTVQHYCVRNHLDCIKESGERGERYVISERSVRTGESATTIWPSPWA